MQKFAFVVLAWFTILFAAKGEAARAEFPRIVQSGYEGQIVEVCVTN